MGQHSSKPAQASTLAHQAQVSTRFPSSIINFTHRPSRNSQPTVRGTGQRLRALSWTLRSAIFARDRSGLSIYFLFFDSSERWLSATVTQPNKEKVNFWESVQGSQELGGE